MKSHICRLAPIVFFIITIQSSYGQNYTLSKLFSMVEAEEQEQARPTHLPYNISTEHFKVHYILSDSDATTDHWVDSIGRYAEQAYDAFEQRGWLLPPPDGTNGGNSLYDIYILDVRSDNGCNGLNVSENPYPIKLGGRCSPDQTTLMV
jgi:hypothetical protein